MNNNTPDHFSHNFELKVEKVPVVKSDRISLRILLPGLFFGAILILLGAYEIFNGFKAPETAFDDLVRIGNVEQYQPLINPAFFDIVFMLIGAGIIISLITSYIRYKKIRFDGKNFEITYRPVYGEKQTFKESLKNYIGVRFRIEFFQFGFINKNKYIVELYHKDPKKIVPLYISTSDHRVRKLWEYYARKFNLPAIMLTDSGEVARQVEDLDKSLIELVKEGCIKDEYDSYEKLPSTIAYVRKKDKIVLKARKIIWDAYNIIAWMFIIMTGLIVLVASFNYQAFITSFNPSTAWGFYITGITGIIISIFILFRKEKLVLKKHKIVHTHKYMLFSTKHDEVAKGEIEAIDVTCNPVTGRYFVSIIADEKTIAFGTKLPINDLRWVKKFLIHEVTKQR